MNLIKNIKLTAFSLMWSIIGMISLVDLFLALWLLDPDHMKEFRLTEKNPVVIELVELTGDMYLFIWCKVSGTILAIFFGKKIFDYSEKWGLTVTGGVLAFQLWLLYYLMYGG